MEPALSPHLRWVLETKLGCQASLASDFIPKAISPAQHWIDFDLHLPWWKYWVFACLLSNPSLAFALPSAYDIFHRVTVSQASWTLMMGLRSSTNGNWGGSLANCKKDNPGCFSFLPSAWISPYPSCLSLCSCPPAAAPPLHQGTAYLITGTERSS